MSGTLASPNTFMPKAFATQIPDGAGRLSTEGTKELIKAGQGTASD